MEGKEINLMPPIVYSVTEQALQQLEQEYANFPTNLEVKENYNFVKKGIATIRKYRSEVEQRRKELKKDALEYGRKVDATAKEIKERLLAIEKPMKKLKKDFDMQEEIKRREEIRKEKERLEKIHERIAGIKSLIDISISQSSTEIQAAITQLESDNVEDWAQEFTEKALETKKNTLAKLTELYDMKVQSERAEEEREKREKELAAQKAEIEAQKEALAEQQRQIEAEKRKAEQERLRAEQLKREKEEAERRKAEQERLKAEKLKKEKEEAEKRKKLDQEYFCQTLDIILPYVKSKKAGTTLLNEIRENKIAHLRWV